MDSADASGGCGPGGGGVGLGRRRDGMVRPLGTGGGGAESRGPGTMCSGTRVRAGPYATSGAGRTRRSGPAPVFCATSFAWISSDRVAIAPCSRFIRRVRASTMSLLRNCMLLITLLSEAISCATVRPHSGQPVTVSARAPQFEQGYDPTAALLSGFSRKACRVTASYG